MRRCSGQLTRAQHSNGGNGELLNLSGPGARFEEQLDSSRPNEALRDSEIAVPRAVRVLGTIYLGLSTTAKTSTQRLLPEG